MFLNHLYGGMDEPELKIIDVFICKLRKKLANASEGRNFIETVWGRGYVLREPHEVEERIPALIKGLRRAERSLLPTGPAAKWRGFCLGRWLPSIALLDKAADSTLPCRPAQSGRADGLRFRSARAR